MTEVQTSVTSQLATCMPSSQWTYSKPHHTKQYVVAVCTYTDIYIINKVSQKKCNTKYILYFTLKYRQVIGQQSPATHNMHYPVIKQIRRPERGPRPTGQERGFQKVLEEEDLTLVRWVTTTSFLTDTFPSWNWNMKSFFTPDSSLNTKATDQTSGHATESRVFSI